MGRGKGKGKKKEHRDPRQQHLDQLHMEYRKMEGKKKKNNEATQNTLRMQTQQIEKLLLDNERLKEDLALETRQGRATNNLSSASKIDRLKDEADEFTRKILAETKRKNELSLKIKELESKLRQQRDAMRSNIGFGSRDYNLSVQRVIRRYESRLDKARIKYNEAQAHNNKLREQIDNLRKDRDSFDGIFKKLTKELRDKKEDVQRLIHVSNDAYKSRGEAQSEMFELKGRADKEQSRFEKEWRGLGSDLQQEQESDELDDTMMASSKGRRRSVYDSMAEDNTEQQLRDQVAESGEKIANDRKEIHLSKEKIRTFEEAFERIQDSTKIEDIDELVEAFLKAEDTNFNLFNKVNEVTRSIEKMQATNQSLQVDLDRYKDLGAGIEVDKRRKNILSELQKKQKKTSDKASLMEKKYENSLKLISNMKKGIKEIFDMIQCDQLEASEELLAEGVTESNMMQYLGLIEEQTNEILDAYQEVKEKEEEDEDEPPPDDEEEELPVNNEAVAEDFEVQMEDSQADAGDEPAEPGAEIPEPEAAGAE